MATVKIIVVFDSVLVGRFRDIEDQIWSSSDEAKHIVLRSGPVFDDCM